MIKCYTNSLNNILNTIIKKIIFPLIIKNSTFKYLISKMYYYLLWKSKYKSNNFKV